MRASLRKIQHFHPQATRHKRQSRWQTKRILFCSARNVVVQGRRWEKLEANRIRFKHGILSVAVLVDDESRPQYELLCRQLHRDFRPEGMFEEILVEKLATLIWRYRRLLQAEAAMVQEQIRTEEEFKKREYALQDDGTDLAMAKMSGDHTQLKALARQAVQRREREVGKGHQAGLELFQDTLPESPRLETFLRYETNLERALDRTLSQLERAQGIRLGQSVLPEQRVRMTLES